MKTEVKYILEKGDAELIEQGIPESPCITRKCSPAEQRSCLGCPEYKKWSDYIAELKKRDIYELAVKRQDSIDARDAVRRLQRELAVAQRKIR